MIVTAETVPEPDFWGVLVSVFVCIWVYRKPEFCTAYNVLWAWSMPYSQGVSGYLCGGCQQRAGPSVQLVTLSTGGLMACICTVCTPSTNCVQWGVLGTEPMGSGYVVD